MTDKAKQSNAEFIAEVRDKGQHHVHVTLREALKRLEAAEAENAELRASHTEQEEMVAELRKLAQESRAEIVELGAELANFRAWKNWELIELAELVDMLHFNQVAEESDSYGVTLHWHKLPDSKEKERATEIIEGRMKRRFAPKETEVPHE